jgi:pheromone shutdown protein TraB
MAEYIKNNAHVQSMNERAMALNEQAMANETLQIKTQAEIFRRGQILSAAVTVLLIFAVLALFALTAWLFVKGYDIAAYLFFALSALVALFGKGKLLQFLDIGNNTKQE